MRGASAVSLSMVGIIVILSLTGAIILWDKLAIGEFGVSQPVVCCPLIGLLFGEFHIGLLLGGVLQLVWVSSLPLGGKEPLDNQGAGVVAITTYILAKKIIVDVYQEQLIFITLLFAGLASIIGQIFSQIMKKANNQLYIRINQKSSSSSIIATNFSGLLTSFLRGFTLTILFQVLLIIISPLLKLLPQFNFIELLILPLAIGIAGIAHLVRQRRIKRRILFSVLGILTGIVLWVIVKL